MTDGVGIAVGPLTPTGTIDQAAPRSGRAPTEG